MKNWFVISWTIAVSIYLVYVFLRLYELKVENDLLEELAEKLNNEMELFDQKVSELKDPKRDEK